MRNYGSEHFVGGSFAVKLSPRADPDAGLALDNVFWNMRVFQLHSPRGLDFIAGKAVLAVTSTKLLILYELRMS